MREHNLGVAESVSMGVIFIAAKIFLAFPRTMAELGETAAWLIVLIACATSLLTWWSMRGILRHYPGETLITATEQAAGPVIGNLLNLVYLAFFFFITFIVLRQFAETINAAILPHTPLPAMTGLLLGAVAYSAYIGIEALTRVSWLFGRLMLIVITSLLIGALATFMAPAALAPVFGPGLPQVAGWGLVKSSLLGELLIFGLLAPSFRRPELLSRAVYWTLGISGALLLATVLAFTLFAPFPTSERMAFPVLQMSRLIIGGRWFQRLEGLYLIAWVICAVVKLAVGLYGCAAILAQMLRVQSHRVLIFPLAMLAYNAAAMPPNLAETVRWDAEILRNFGWIASLAVPTLTWLPVSLRPQGRAARAAR